MDGRTRDSGIVVCQKTEIRPRAALSILTVRDGLYNCLLLVVSYALWRLDESQLAQTVYWAAQAMPALNFVVFMIPGKY
jgi:hypothetical protein